MFEGMFLGWNDDGDGESMFDSPLDNVVAFAILYPQMVVDGDGVVRELQNGKELIEWAEENFDYFDVREIA